MNDLNSSTSIETARSTVGIRSSSPRSASMEAKKLLSRRTLPCPTHLPSSPSIHPSHSTTPPSTRIHHLPQRRRPNLSSSLPPPPSNPQEAQSPSWRRVVDVQHPSVSSIISCSLSHSPMNLALPLKTNPLSPLIPPLHRGSRRRRVRGWHSGA
ncbi:hypothetical protein BC829DRAFT_268343 [Chytridium lagenaria]|nr:hypothetical protein BC829DRAFT_268343 [Chytridium lagenaria]